MTRDPAEFLTAGFLDKLAARLRLGSSFELDLPIVPPKPIALHGFWPLGVVAAVWHGRIMDRLGL